MNTTQNKKRPSIEERCRSLGIVGLIQCIQKADRGHGDYVKDRQEWQNEYSVDMLLKAVEKSQ